MKCLISPALMAIAAMGVCRAATLSVVPDRTRVAMGEQINVTLKIVSPKEVGNVPVPPLASNESFTVLRSSQNQSQNTSIQMVNGKMVQKTENIREIHYTIVPKKEGVFSFPSLEIQVGGQRLKSKPVAITVTKQPVQTPEATVKLIASNANPYAGEQIVLTLQVAKKETSPAQLTRDGFYRCIEQIVETLGKSFSTTLLLRPGQEIKGVRERIGGEFYHVFKVQWAVIPLVDGTYSLSSVPFEYVVQQRVQSRRGMDPFFDGFFGFGSSVRQVPRTAFSNKLTIKARPLPPAPKDFSGAVGTFSLSADVDPRTVPAGDAVTLKINLRGNTRPGNMGEITLPKMDNIEVFTPEKSTAVDTGRNGISTRKSYKYLLVPQEEGAAVIPGLSWKCFDPKRQAYRTLTTDSLTITVTKGTGGRKERSRYLTQAEIQEVGRDIRYIKTATELKSQPSEPYKNPIFYILYPLPFLVAVFSLLYRLQSTRQRDMARVLSSRAGRLARKEIVRIKKDMDRLSGVDLLGRISLVIEGYISRKFGFAATGKTLEELREELAGRGVDQAVISDLASFIETTSRYRFGGEGFSGDAKTGMVGTTEEFIRKLEKPKSAGKGRRS